MGGWVINITLNDPRRATKRKLRQTEHGPSSHSNTAGSQVPRTNTFCGCDFDVLLHQYCISTCVFASLTRDASLESDRDIANCPQALSIHVSRLRSHNNRNSVH
eukprot:m.41824 g.41824  ORF g.41824 m.41824 type:complete len:104 (+) comp8255_c0_seq1:26-337(+)